MREHHQLKTNNMKYDKKRNNNRTRKSINPKGKSGLPNTGFPKTAHDSFYSRVVLGWKCASLKWTSDGCFEACRAPDTCVRRPGEAQVRDMRGSTNYPGLAQRGFPQQQAHSAPPTLFCSLPLHRKHLNMISACGLYKELYTRGSRLYS